MKVFLTNLDKGDGLVFAFTEPFEKFVEVVPIEQADYIFVILMNRVGWTLDEVAAKAVMASDKPKIVFDYWEIDWHTPSINPPHGVLPELFQWKAYFKRHLQAEKVDPFDFYAGGSIYPIDFYNHLTWPTLDSFDEFQARPIDILMTYGLSHPMRPAVHASLLAACHDYGWTFITKPEHMLKEEPPFVVLLHTPHYDRLPMDELMLLQSQAKITISLPGAGTKCFRHSEAPINSVMAMPKDNLAWQAGWDGSNSIQVESTPEKWPLALKVEIDHPQNLYQLYLNGTKRAMEIKPDKVWNEYLKPIITI